MSKSEIVSKLKQSKRSKCLTLSAYNLSKVPEGVFQLPMLTRLDLSVNNLQQLPSQIGNLINLQQLWANDNPIIRVSSSIQFCKKLRTVDLSRTRIQRLPRQMVNIPKLVELNLDGCPLKQSLSFSYRQGVIGIWAQLQEKQTRSQYKQDVFKVLRQNIYPGQNPHRIMGVTLEVFKNLKDLTPDNLKLFLHNLRRIFPQKLDYVDPGLIRRNFDRILNDLDTRAQVSKLSLRLKKKYPTVDMQTIANTANNLYFSLSKQQINVMFKEKMLPSTYGELTIDDLEGSLGNYFQKVREQLDKSKVGLKSRFRNFYAGREDEEEIDRCADTLADMFKQPASLTNFIMIADQYLPESLNRFNPKSIKQAYMLSRGND